MAGAAIGVVSAGGRGWEYSGTTGSFAFAGLAASLIHDGGDAVEQREIHGLMGTNGVFGLQAEISRTATERAGKPAV